MPLITITASSGTKEIDISTLNIAVPEFGKAHITGAAVSQEEMNRIAEIVRNVNVTGAYFYCTASLNE